MRDTVLALTLFLLATHSARAATWITATWGSDSVTCGTQDDPCRSISRAIANAGEGDTVLVGPGYYGNLNGDGDFADPGDEAAEIGSGCQCVIRIDKRVTVKSRDGANLTVIDGDGDADSVVHLMSGASSAVFGGPQHGFTLRNSGHDGLTLDDGVTGVQILGNISQQNAGNGMEILGAGAIVKGNRALANAQDGFDLLSQGAVASGNIAQRNGADGFLVLDAEVVLERCIASGNGNNGFLVALAQADFHAVVSVGNFAAGVMIAEDSSGRVTSSTLMGNGRGDGGNCGVDNESGQTMVATGNYWGASTGPGDDPADDVCLTSGSMLDIRGFKSKELRLKLPALR